MPDRSDAENRMSVQNASADALQSSIKILRVKMLDDQQLFMMAEALEFMAHNLKVLIAETPNSKQMTI